MNTSLLTLTSAALLSLAPLAHAETAIWDYQGQLTDVAPASPYQVGERFEAIVSFDRAAADLTPTNPNRHSLDISSLKISYQIGSTGWQSLDASAGGLIYLRDNQTNPADPGGPRVDGLTFGLGAVSLILRWNDLSAINYSQGLLPGTPPALNNLAANAFQEGNNSWIGQINSVTAVPEPASYALLLVGLGLMGAVARRRAATSAAFPFVRNIKPRL